MGHAFHLEERGDGIAVLTFDLPDRKVNTLGRAVLDELGTILQELASRAELRGLLFRSGKPGQFIAGADLAELGALALATQQEAARAIALGRGLFGMFEELPFPVVALIDGHCMGGGTELVLAMDDRIVSDAPHTMIGLPEVKLGLIPAWGGTQRLPRLIGLGPAIEAITTGEAMPAKKAVALGLAFDAVSPEALIAEGVRRIEQMREEGHWREDRRRRSGPIGLGQDALMFAVGVAEGAIAAKAKGGAKAPQAALKAMRNGLNRPLDEGLLAEGEAAMDVFGSPAAANLIGVFLLQTRAGRDPGVDAPGVVPADIGRVGVLGAGLMGSGIAAAFARSGIPTAMVDVDQGRIADGLRRASEVVASRIKIGRASSDDLAAMLGHLSTSTSTGIFADCDLVIEAVTEDEAVKTAMLRDLSRVLKPGAIVASNTSTISITRMAGSLADPSRFIGMHFFSPVDRMALVEVVRGERTGDEAVATAVALARRLRKTPIVVKDGPGFLVNRLLFPYLSEALAMLQEGVPMDAIDAAAEAFGMPMGPIALEDAIGLDVAAFAGRVMAQAYPDRAEESPILADLVRAGRLGKKSGAGFRRYSGKRGRPEADPAFAPILAKYTGGASRELPAEVITDRLFLPMLFEASRAIEEGIARDPGDVDLALILGIGFPPTRGGLLRWCDAEGAANLLGRAERHLASGQRFVPTASLVRLARSGGTFYPRPN